MVFYESLCIRVAVFYVLLCKERLRQKAEAAFYASLCTKRREGVFSPSAQKTDFVHIKAPLIHQWKDEDILQGMNRIH